MFLSFVYILIDIQYLIVRLGLCNQRIKQKAEYPYVLHHSFNNNNNNNNNNCFDIYLSIYLINTFMIICHFTEIEKRDYLYV